MIRVLIVEDHAVVLKGLTMLIGGEQDMEIAGDAFNGEDALAILARFPTIDIVLADFNMPKMDGVELSSRITAVYDHPKVIILTMHQQASFQKKAIAAGAKGYLLKGESNQELFDCIRAVHAGQTFVSPAFRSDR